MKLTKNFNLSEFACKDEAATPVPSGLIGNVQLLADNIQVLRDDIGTPVDILSGYRTPAHNAKVGGKPNSFHMKAMAGDLAAKEFTPKQLYLRIEKLIRAGKMKAGGLGLYPGFVHYDVRGRNVRF
jgi:uncharacterized protein YcbK (DUF882 family)